MKLLPLICASSLLVFVGCSGRQAKVNENGWPNQLVFAFSPDEEDPGRRESIYEMMGVYLEERLGIDVKIIKTSSYGPVIEAMRAKKVDMSNLSTFTYMIASQKVGVEPVVARSYENGEPRTYHAVFITRTDSQWKDLDELIADSKNVRFAFVNPASTSGHLLPRAALEKLGVVPEKDFKELVYPGSQSGTILSVLSGQVDAASVSDASVRKLVRTGKLKEGDFRVLGKSPAIPSSCIAIRSEVPATLKAAIRQAYLDMSTKAPELNEDIKGLTSQYIEEPLGDYIVVEDSLYDGLRELSRNIESLAMLR